MDESDRAAIPLKRRDARPMSNRRYVGCWVERDLLNNDIVDAFVMILRTQGCHWALKSGCLMCGYINEAAKGPVSDEDLWFQYEKVMERYSGESIVKIFTSGSFLDESEISKATGDRILEDLAQRTDRIIIESRPEFIHSARVKGKKNLEVALGLESASNFVLEHSVNKGFGFEDYLKAASILAKEKIHVKTYLLVKPPFLTERDAVNDAVRSAGKVACHTGTISFNPVSIKKYTIVERLWKKGEYRPPWLWSVVEVLRRSSSLENVRVMSSPTGGGTTRGAHNCGRCDREVLRAISEFSLSQDASVLDGPDCDCRNLWEEVRRTENIAHFQGDITRLV